MIPEDEREFYVNRGLGLMFGLLVGDAVEELAADPGDDPPWLVGGSASQLACFTLEGLIRASTHGDYHEGWGDYLGPVWRAYGRWALNRRLVARVVDMDAKQTETGWLATVAILKKQRGSAPATVSALARKRGSTEDPVAYSAGHHALSRTAPFALSQVLTDQEPAARELAALTHGHPAAWDAAAAGVLLLRAALTNRDVPTALEVARAVAVEPGVRSLLVGTDVGEPGTAPYCLTHGIRTAMVGGTLREVVVRAGEYGVGTAAFAGALHGTLKGAAALDPWELSRLELGWVADKLVRDVVRQELDHPGPGWLGSQWPEDPTWFTQYPPT